MIYSDHVNKQKVAKLLHTYMHNEANMVHTLIVGITKLDNELYSDKTRKRIQLRLCVANDRTTARTNCGTTDGGTHVLHRDHQIHTIIVGNTAVSGRR